MAQSLHLRSEQDVEWRRKLGLHAGVRANENPLEEHLVELSPDVVGCRLVGQPAVLREIERGVEIGLDDVEVQIRRLELAGDLKQPGSDAVLLALEQIKRNRTLVMGLLNRPGIPGDPVV